MGVVDPRYWSFGWAWVLLCCALVLHVADEATTGFLRVYNPTVLALRTKLGWWPMPTFEFREWLYGLVAACAVLLALSVLAFRGLSWMRWLAYLFAVVMLLNAVGHTLATIFGRTVDSVRFPRPAPGFWSSPLMAAAAINLLVQVGRITVPRT